MIDNITKFIFEMGQLKRIRHEGWRLAGVENPGSVAGHVMRAAQIGFLLAEMEKYEKPQEVCTMLVFHDIGEARIGDIHKVANRYVEANEEKAVKEQLERINGYGEEIFNLWTQIETQNSPAGIIAKDADLLEQAFTAKEYVEKGHSFAQDWINNVSKRVRTDSAKKLLDSLQKTEANSWWQGLKKIS